MFASFVCAVLSSRARKFPSKPETREPREIIAECTSYTYIYIYGQWEGEMININGGG